MENYYFLSLLVVLFLILFSSILFSVFALSANRLSHKDLDEEERLKHIRRRKRAAERATQEHLKIKEQLIGE